jgi:hypothetical protein
VALEELFVPGVRKGELRGDLRALADRILFTCAHVETVRPDYTPAYAERKDEHVESTAYSDVSRVERGGDSVRLQTAGGEEEFGFDREADAETFAALVEARMPPR